MVSTAHANSCPRYGVSGLAGMRHLIDAARSTVKAIECSGVPLNAEQYKTTISEFERRINGLSGLIVDSRGNTENTEEVRQTVEGLYRNLRNNGFHPMRDVVEPALDLHSTLPENYFALQAIKTFDEFTDESTGRFRCNNNGCTPLWAAENILEYFEDNDQDSSRLRRKFMGFLLASVSVATDIEAYAQAACLAAKGDPSEDDFREALEGIREASQKRYLGPTGGNYYLTAFNSQDCEGTTSTGPGYNYLVTNHFRSLEVTKLFTDKLNLWINYQEEPSDPAPLVRLQELLKDTEQEKGELLSALDKIRSELAVPEAVRKEQDAINSERKIFGCFSLANNNDASVFLQTCFGSYLVDMIADREKARDAWRHGEYGSLYVLSYLQVMNNQSMRRSGFIPIPLATPTPTTPTVTTPTAAPSTPSAPTPTVTTPTTTPSPTATSSAIPRIGDRCTNGGTVASFTRDDATGRILVLCRASTPTPSTTASPTSSSNDTTAQETAAAERAKQEAEERKRQEALKKAQELALRYAAAQQQQAQQQQQQAAYQQYLSNLFNNANQTNTTAVAPTCSAFSASKTTITAGEEITLSWKVTGAAKIIITPKVKIVKEDNTTVAKATPLSTLKDGYTLIAANSSGEETRCYTKKITVEDEVEEVEDGDADTSGATSTEETGV